MAGPLDQTFSNLFAQRLPAQSPTSILAALSTFIVLRWADLQEADQEAIAAFDGTSFAPSLVPGGRWRDLFERRGRSIGEVLREQVLPGLDRARDTGAGALVRRIRWGVEHTSTGGEAILGKMLEMVRAMPLATPADREQVLDAIDGAYFSTSYLPGTDGDPMVATPRPVVELVVELASPQPGERVYDPCFGIAAVLAACARRVRERIKASPPGGRAGTQPSAFLGVEINPEAFVIGLARMILAGVDRPALELGNTLERPLPKNRDAEGFDCIVAHPPFGGKLLPDAAAQFPVKATSAEALFLQHIAASLRPGGRAVVVLPEGAFFRGGGDAAVRRLLLDEYRVEAVLSHVVYSTVVRTGVLVLRREAPGGYVRFVDAQKPSDAGHVAAARAAGVLVPPFEPIALAATVRGETTAYEVREVPVEDLVRDDATFMPPRRDGPLELFVQAVRAADAQVPVPALEEVADLFAGLRTKAGEIVQGRGDPSLVGLLGPMEVEDGETRPPGRSLARTVTPPGNLRLRSGDVVLTLATILGRAAVVANGATGSVAGNGLGLLRPREGLSPHYLAAMLQSPPFRAWISERARGSSVQSLPLTELRCVPIPVPDLALQDRLMRAHRAEGTDISALLLRALTSAPEDPFVTWIESSAAVQRLLAIKDGAPPQQALDAIENLAFDMQWILTRSYTARALDLMAWAHNTATALHPLRNIREVGPGTARFAILNVAYRGLDFALRQLLVATSTGSVMHLAGEISRTLLGFSESLSEIWAKDFKLVPSLDRAVLEAGTGGAVTLRVRNEGPMPVRDIVIQTPEPVFGAHEHDFKFHASAVYLDVGQEISTTTAVLPPKGASTIGFQVLWGALQLDGRRAAGEFPLAIEVRAPWYAAATPDLGPSPYIVGSPVEQREMLYGRDVILRNIKRQLATDHRANVVLLEGNRRTGKTSILRRLEAPGEIPGWIPVDINLQSAEGSEGRAGLSSKEIFRLLAQKLALALVKAGTPVWLPDTPRPDPKRYELQLRRALTPYFEGDHPFEAFEIYVKTVVSAIAPVRVLFMLDEFDKIQEGIDAGITSPQVPENIRYLFQTYPQVGGILSGSRRLTRLRNEYWSALFGIGYPVRVGALAVEDARALVTGPALGQLVYAPDARDRIVELCARQPFLIQTLCNRIFEEAAERGERTVTPDAVARAAAAMTGDNEHFETLWGYAKTDRRRLILALLCRLARDIQGRPLDAGVLEDALAHEGVAPPPGGIGEDMDHLRELELCELETHEGGYQRYRVAVPLMTDWVLRNKDFSDLVKRAAREQDAARE